MTALRSTRREFLLDAKVAAMREYPTQISVDGAGSSPCLTTVGQGRLIGLEHYRLARGMEPPRRGGHRSPTCSLASLRASDPLATVPRR